MKFSAALAAIIFSAAPAIAQNWAPAVNSDQLSAIETPAAAAPSRANPRDGQNYSGAEELLIMEFRITSISLDIPEAEVMQQNSFENAFCFEHALRQALNALLEDYSNTTSPLARTLGEMGALAKPTKSDLKKARQKLMDRLNTPSTYISIVRPYKHNQPQAGETVEKNWIFFLRLDGKSYWAVVDRSGSEAPYVYGMN